MTAIWDSTSRFIRKIMDDEKDPNQKSSIEKRTAQLQVFFRMLRAVTDRKSEYGKMPTEYWWRKEEWRAVLKRLSDSPCTQDEDLGAAVDLIQLFHEFDHLSLPYRGKTTFGHFTETAIRSLKPSKDQLAVLDAIYRCTEG